MQDNPLLQLPLLGQSVWLDLIRRGMIDSGELKRLIDEDGLRGVTANPSIFEKAIGGSHDYDASISAQPEDRTPAQIYETLAVEDVQRAADLFHQVYLDTDGGDGYVSLEVSPRLAHDTAGTIDEARRFWAELARENVMIKVPATSEGIPAIRQLTSEGLNINVTLLFGLPRYREVAAAFIGGLEDRLNRGEPIDRIHSVASFFLSRIDVLVDPMLEKIMREDDQRSFIARSVHGEIAVASAKVAYEIYNEIFRGDRFRQIALKGGNRQRLLWASTSTKNPEYPDLKYVEPLIGPETVNTMPMETLNAFRDHGHPAFTLEDGILEAHSFLDRLQELGIDLDQVTQQLEDEGVEKFDTAYDRLLKTIGDKVGAAGKTPLDQQSFQLGKSQETAEAGIRKLDDSQFGARLWRKDPSLWKGNPEDQKSILNGLGWLHVAEKEIEKVEDLKAFAEEVRAAGFRHVVDLGMGGSTLAPMVFARSFKPAEGGLPLTVLDSTVPEMVAWVAEQVPVAHTLFIVASKSGTTAEPIAFMNYFYDLVQREKGDRAGENFVAITDPGTPLTEQAQQLGFRRCFLNYSDIGGRYSALSLFGLLPAALMGLDVGELLEQTQRLVHASASCLDADQNPGIRLGGTIGALANAGRDKLTFVVSPVISSLGMWLEQLLAESTGKEGKGILPVAGEPVGEPEVYGQDRLFAHILMKDGADVDQERRIAALAKAGQPVITIRMADLLDLGQEFYRWEVATAAAGFLLGINPFDQPNVQESKDNTNRLIAQVKAGDRLPEEEPRVIHADLSYYTNHSAPSAAELLKWFLGQAKTGDYLAIQAYLPETQEIDEALQTLRVHLRDQTHLATTLGYGPRFLHSTGQFHKGGPNTGLFIQLTADDPVEVPIPGEPYGFSTLKRAQAQGDLEALRKHGRRVIRVHLGKRILPGLSLLEQDFGL